MSGAGSRRKGLNGENELASLLTDALGVVVKRSLDQSRDGGADLCIGRARIQVKRCERLDVGEWWTQANFDAPGLAAPVLAYRQSRRPWRFRMWLEDVLGETDGRCAGLVELDMDAFVWVARERFL